MVEFATSATGLALPPSADELRVGVPAIGREQELRCVRILRLRDAIAAGEYWISAAVLAGALLNAARRAN